MSKSKKETLQKISTELAKQPETSGFSFKGLLDKLPNWALVPLTIVIFGLLITDTAIADPIPFVDEAALFYALISSMRVLGSRRKQGKELEGCEEPESVIDFDPEPLPAGQPRL